jgi:rhodanese-related sulfurtransferase
MPEGIRITADEVRQRMEAGEEFTIVDVRNPQAWAEATDKAAGAIRIALNAGDQALSRIPGDKPAVAYCT